MAKALVLYCLVLCSLFALRALGDEDKSRLGNRITLLARQLMNEQQSIDEKRIQLEEKNQLKNTITLLARQMMMQQQFNEERIRSEGSSGIKAKRHRREGTRPYYSDSFTGLSFMSIHDHSNHIRTIGMGEFVAVLNGVEFRTRHNDYALYQPSKTSSDYHAVQEIPFPDVPPDVKGSVDEQIPVMRDYFRSFKAGKKGLKDHSKYFKPVLCYLEGAWTLTDPANKIEEPFISDRHTFSATDWLELHRKTRFTAYTGSKDTGENLGFLPTTIVDMVNDTEPLYAQWNYRIMCHPLKKYMEPDRLRVVDDLAIRMAMNRKLSDHAMSRSARFQLNSYNSEVFHEGYTTYTFLDRLMAQIPGKDNYYGKSLTDNAFGFDARNYENSDDLLRANRFHRWYQLIKPGANGRTEMHRSFADDNVFMAMNTRKEVAEQTMRDCTRDKKTGLKTCTKTYKQRWSYAIPLEIIYLTPLLNWNPYDIKYNEDVTDKGKRNGEKSREKAFKGFNNNHYYRTPEEFYSGKTMAGDEADTSGKSVGVLNGNGKLCNTVASGTYIVTPEIDGVGKVRLRYPIAPIHQEGTANWKETEAFKDLMLAQEAQFNKIREELGLKPVQTSD